MTCAELTKIGINSQRFHSQIIPIVIGETETTLTIQNQLRERGILVGAIRPPTVPKRTDRLRISIHSDVLTSDLSEILEVLKLWKQKKK